MHREFESLLERTRRFDADVRTAKDGSADDKERYAAGERVASAYLKPSMSTAFNILNLVGMVLNPEYLEPLRTELGMKCLDMLKKGIKLYAAGDYVPITAEMVRNLLSTSDTAPHEVRVRAGMENLNVSGFIQGLFTERRLLSMAVANGKSSHPEEVRTAAGKRFVDVVVSRNSPENAADALEKFLKPEYAITTETREYAQAKLEYLREDPLDQAIRVAGNKCGASTRFRTEMGMKAISMLRREPSVESLRKLTELSNIFDHPSEVYSNAEEAVAEMISSIPPTPETISALRDFLKQQESVPGYCTAALNRVRTFVDAKTRTGPELVSFETISRRIGERIKRRDKSRSGRTKGRCSR